MKKNNLVIYQAKSGAIEFRGDFDKETIWASQAQIVDLFAVHQSVISRHVRNIFKDKEVDQKSNMQKMHIANSDKPVSFYSLDIVLAVGYRTNSSKAIRFRQWATSVLKSYITNGYAINSEKITNERFVSLENEVFVLKSQMGEMKALIKNDSIKPSKGIFFDGQTYDAYVFVNDLLKSVKSEVVLIDNYIDDTVFTFFSKYPELNIKIYTQTISKQLRLDYQKYTSQYQNIELREFKNAHDRFMILDNKEVYHIGASLKDLGKKWFAFSKFEMEALEILGRLK